MYKSLRLSIKITCFFFFALFIFGCDRQTEPPSPPKVITQKIAVSAPAQPAPVQPSEPTQKTPPAKPEASTKTVQPKQQPATEINTTTAPPVTPAAQSMAKQTTVSEEKPGKVEPVPAPKGKAAVTAAKVPDTSKEDKAADDAGEKEPESGTSETDLQKLVADTAGGYSPAGKVDPFLPLFEEKPVTPEEDSDAEKQKAKRRMPLTPLERVDLSQLKLVGIIQAPSGNKALVEESSGKGYIIKKGTFIGIHSGRVLEIQKDRVVVEEEVENVLGHFTVEKKELKLQKPPGEF
ncbi:MAG: pilus assembly protein PilP [Thermodesulfobacteriota bacterium]